MGEGRGPTLPPVSTVAVDALAEKLTGAPRIMGEPGPPGRHDHLAARHSAVVAEWRCDTVRLRPDGRPETCTLAGLRMQKFPVRKIQENLLEHT